MSRKIWLGVVSALALAGTAVAATAVKVPAHVTAALADKSRPEADMKRDATRRPGELLAWAEVKPGAKVVDYMMGGGYLTRLLAAAVGPKGHVTAYQADEFVKMRAAYGEEQKAALAGLANVTPLNGSVTSVDFPDRQDLVITVQNYHDLHWTGRMPDGGAAHLNAEAFKSLKPGGVFIVVDHAAQPGASDAPGKLHRIDPAIIRKEATAAGFRYEGELDLWRNPADPKDKGVFDPSIRGKTDQVAYKFRKPR